MIHWAHHYIGKRDVNCWEFVCQVYKNLYNLELSQIDETTELNNTKNFNSHKELKDWQEVLSPIDTDVALMTQRKYNSHIGLVALPMGIRNIVHVVDNMGVVAQDTGSLTINGFKITKFFRHRSLLIGGDV